MKYAYEKARDFFDTTNLRYTDEDILKLEQLLLQQDLDAVLYMRKIANNVWDSVTDCLNQFDIDQIERTHKDDLTKLGVI
jgi:hypothetical protein